MYLEFNLEVFENKKELFNFIHSYIVNHLKLRIDKQDEHRPWGGFFLIDESDAEQFKKIVFPRGIPDLESENKSKIIDCFSFV